MAKVFVEIEVPEGWSNRLNMQQHIEAEISADRWGWRYKQDRDLSHALESLDYWLGLCECVCASSGPIGACEYCDLLHIKDAIRYLNPTEDR